MDSGERHYSFMRHLPRDKAFAVSEEGREVARQKGLELVKEIEDMPQGSVVLIPPSIVERNKITRDIFETTLQEAFAGREDIGFVSVTDKGLIENVKADPVKKFIITDISPQTLLSIPKDHPGLPAFGEMLNLSDGDEEWMGKLWFSQPDELREMLGRANASGKDVDIAQFHPNRIIDTPETFAINYIRSLRRMHEILNKYFPDKPSRVINITHDFYSDAATLALMGKEISAASIEEFGGFRHFLESSEILFKGNEATVSYRGVEVPIAKSLDETEKELEEKSKARLEWWNKKDA